MRRIIMRLSTGFLVTALFLLIGCDSDSSGDGPGDSPLNGGIVATFNVTGTEFSIWITNESTIDQVLALDAGTSNANIPNGEILRGPGTADHNDSFSWHISPENVEMAELTVEVCDGTPTFVEENVDYFVDDVGRYCPWSAELVSVEDYR